ncbi:hypothetical protein N780_19580 [Pontibacillus chungwhensis BH030062]|uniref:Helicase SNF2 n=1 Tax=Pontibacillus chungwhensis BH030062 TaxID=1385513 RepID=A0A0A2VCQ8_9BACI|nr:DEAD/DEAH box helicase [Pontibacillus chungwhensis]KGP91425.1 hypothetical protein N780_19580 [Pontibacillus chungwhensis BH030062]
MIDITSTEVLELSGWLTYQRGANYYQDGLVKYINRYVGTDPNRTFVHATVEGSRIEDYEVHLTFSTQYGNYERGRCTCPAYADGQAMCKHMVAALLETIGRYTNNTTVWNKQNDSLTERGIFAQPSATDTAKQLNLASSFVDELMDYMASEEDEAGLFQSSKEPLYLQFELENIASRFAQRDSVELSMKAGTSRLYVVKDLAEFIDAWYEQEPLYFTQYYTYDPEQQIMAPEDAAVLEKLYPLVKSQQMYAENDFYRSSSSKKTIRIPDQFLTELLTLFEECDSVVLKHHKSEIPFKVVHNTFPESFLLSKEGDNFSLSIADNGFLAQPIGTAPYLYKDELIYKVSDSLRPTVLPLFHHLREQSSNRQLFDREHIEQLAGTVFPILEAHNLLQVDSGITSQIKRYDLAPVMYLNEQDGSLRADLEFHYGDETINPFTGGRQDSEQLLSRNMKKERQIMNLIEQANFHWNGSVLSLSGSQNLGRFFYRILPELEKRADVYKAPEVDEMYSSLPEEVPVSLDVDENYGWFEVRFPTDDLTDADIQQLFHSLKAKEDYHQLSNGKILSLEDDAWDNTRSLFEDLDLDGNDIQDGVMHLPKYRALQVDTSTGVKQSEAFQKLIETVKSPETLNETPPDKLQANLRDYQLRGFQWLRALSRHGFGGVLADEMGLGKTLQGLAYIVAGREERPDAHPFLVVAPASLIYNWEQEAKKFTPHLNIRVVAGSKQERNAIIEDLSGVDLIITSYSMIRRDVEQYKAYYFQGMLLDEAQSFKNHTSLTYKAIQGVRAETAFALTGTPVENRAEELWSLFSVVMPGLLYDRKTFKNLPQGMVQKKITPFVLRRTKKEVLKELPDKIQTVRYTELTKEQRQLYVGYLNEVQRQTKSQLQGEGFQANRMQILSNLTRLRQICCHPSLFMENYQGDSGKLEELRTFIQEAHANGQRMLIFSQFTSMLGLIAKVVEEENLTYFYLDGSTPSQERVQMATRFNEGEHDVFLISLKAGGTGLNLTGADTVVLYDLWWNPAVEQQAADRAHRIGQKKSVQVVKMIAQGTIEEKIQSLQEKKQDLFDTLIQSGEGNLTALSEDDIREILSI